MSDKMISEADHEAEKATLRKNFVDKINALNTELRSLQDTIKANADKLAQADALAQELTGLKARGAEDEALRGLGADPSAVKDHHRSYLRAQFAEASKANPALTLADFLAGDEAKNDVFLGSLFKAPPSTNAPPAPPAPTVPGAPPPPSKAAPTAPPPKVSDPAGALAAFNAAAGMPFRERVALLQKATP